MHGKHEGWDQVLRQGHVAMMKAVIDIGAHADQAKRRSLLIHSPHPILKSTTGKRKNDTELVLECQGSSIGQYTTQWLNEFYSSCSGISPEKWIHKSKKSREGLPFPNIKILFPSLTTVENSILGTDGGGTMFCKEKNWRSARELFHDSNSKRGGVLMHTKVRFINSRNTMFY
jgi:tyrosyl-DNA phosphodiesterase 1